MFVGHHLPFVGLSNRRDYLAALAPRYARAVFRRVEVANVERSTRECRLHLGPEQTSLVDQLEPALDWQRLARSQPVDPHHDANGPVAASLDPAPCERSAANQRIPRRL